MSKIEILLNFADGTEDEDVADSCGWAVETVLPVLSPVFDRQSDLYGSPWTSAVITLCNPKG